MAKKKKNTPKPRKKKLSEQSSKKPKPKPVRKGRVLTAAEQRRISGTKKQQKEFQTKGRRALTPSDLLRLADTPRKRANVFRETEANRASAAKAGVKLDFGKEYETAKTQYDTERREKKKVAKGSWREKKRKEKKNKAEKKSKAAVKRNKRDSRKKK